MFCRLFALSRRELAVLLTAFVLSLPAVTPRIYSSDEIQYFSYLRSVWFDHDVSFENEYRYFYARDVGRAEGFHETFLELQTDAGRRPNFGTIGCAVLWAPFYAVGDLAARVMRAAGRPVAVDGLSQPYIAAVAYGSAVYGFLAVLLSIGAARRILVTTETAGPAAFGFASGPVPPGTPASGTPGSWHPGTPAPGTVAPGAPAPGTPAPGTLAPRHPGTPGPWHPGTSSAGPLAAGLLVWLGTPLLFYTYIAPPMSHACSAFAVALFVTVWLRVRRAWTPAGAVMLGLCGGLMAMVREQDAFFALGPALDFALTRFAAPGQRLRGLATAAAGCAAFALALAPQLLSYSRLNGYARPSKLVARKMTWTAPHAWEVLFSTAHGYVFWTPLAVLALSGLVVLAARRGGDIRRVALILLLTAALQVYVGGSVESWSVAGAFGQRRFVALSVLLVVGLAALWQAFPKGSWRTALLAASVVCVWWNLSLTALFGTGMMNRKRLELARNAYDAFVTLPRVGPQLAWRYVFDRQSFYRNVPPPRVP